MRVRVSWRVSIRFVGMALSYLTVPLLFPLALALWYGDPLVPFLAAIGVSLALGAAMRVLGADGELGVREAFLGASLIWLLVAVVGAVPFVAAGSGVTAHPLNALFESMSGVTTTGATVMLDFDAHSQSLMMWRQVIQWLGGLGILILATAILTEIGVGGAQLMETETWTPTTTKLTPRIAETARLLFGIYATITAVTIATLYGLNLAGLAPNMTLYNAVAHALTAVSTAGFSPEPESAGAFVPVAQWVLLAAMLTGGTSFTLIYLAATDRLSRLIESEELRFYLGAVGLASTAVAGTLLVDPRVSYGPAATLRHALFNTVSLLTTTGYASVDFNVWAPGAKYILFACMFLGAMVGSTTCSVKTLRWLVVLKSFRRELFTSVHMSAVRPIRVGETTIDEEIVRDVYGFVLLSLLLVAALTAIIVLDAARVGLAVSEFEAMSAAASTFLNIGPAFGIAGPYDSYQAFPWTTKVAMILLMWVGRVEIIPVLVLFTRSFWTT